MDTAFHLYLLILMLQTPVGGIKGSDFNGTWRLHDIYTTNNPMIGDIGNELFRTEKTLVVVQTASEIRVSRKGNTQDGRPVVNQASYGFSGQGGRGAILSGNALRFKRSIEAFVHGGVFRMESEEQWTFRDNKKTLWIEANITAVGPDGRIVARAGFSFAHARLKGEA